MCHLWIGEVNSIFNVETKIIVLTDYIPLALGAEHTPELTKVMH